MTPGARKLRQRSSSTTGSTCSPVSGSGNHSLTWSAKLSLRRPAMSGPPKSTRTMRGVIRSTLTASSTRGFSGYISTVRSLTAAVMGHSSVRLRSVTGAGLSGPFPGGGRCCGARLGAVSGGAVGEHPGGAQAREGQGEHRDGQDGQHAARGDGGGRAQQGGECAQGEG